MAVQEEGGPPAGFSGAVAGLIRYGEKGTCGEVLESALLREGMGMEGDWHAGGERQISLLPLELRRWIDAQTEPGLCFRRFRENILFEGTAVSPAPGTRLRAGEAALEISAQGKHCFEDCPLFKRGSCMLAGQNLFARVTKSGMVRIGDRLEIEP
jgi:MOSC domain-containing protein YiiM